MKLKVTKLHKTPAGDRVFKVECDELNVSVQVEREERSRQPFPLLAENCYCNLVYCKGDWTLSEVRWTLDVDLLNEARKKIISCFLEKMIDGA